METIKIKRATMNGLKEAKGELMEAYGLQFCFIKAVGDFMLIELSSGGNVKFVDSYSYTKKEARQIMRDELNRRTLIEFQYAIKKFAKINKSRYNIAFPVNESV